jgi:hypothetical protein
MKLNKKSDVRRHGPRHGARHPPLTVHLRSVDGLFTTRLWFIFDGRHSGRHGSRYFVTRFTTASLALKKLPERKRFQKSLAQAPLF